MMSYAGMIADTLIEQLLFGVGIPPQYLQSPVRMLVRYFFEGSDSDIDAFYFKRKTNDNGFWRFAQIAKYADIKVVWIGANDR